LFTRQFVLIPGSHHPSGTSLSPHPLEDEEQQRKRGRVKRFMTTTKCTEWDVAGVYLEDEGWDVDRALERWFEDEAWERGRLTREKRQTNKSRSRWSLFGR
jgi:hypothetical protein